MTALDQNRLIADAAKFLGDPAFRESPEAFYNELLDGHRIFGLGNGIWLIAGHEEIRTVLRDDRFSRSARAGQECGFMDTDPRPDVQRMGQCQRGMMLSLDSQEHARIRKFHRPPFLPRGARKYKHDIELLADELARNLPRGKEFDLKREFSLPIPERIICRILGVPAEDHKLWEEWTDAIVGMDRTGHGTDVGTNRAGDAMRSFGEYFDKLIALRRAEPGDDLISELANAVDYGTLESISPADNRINLSGDRLSDDELVGNLILLIAAGHETTANSIATAVVLLLRDRQHWNRLVKDESLAEAAIEEVLRLEGAQRFMVPRVAVEDVAIGDQVIAAGDQVICLLHAANRDPKVFDDAGSFDITRSPSAHLAFGSGAHFCLGVHLARMEMVAAIKALVRHHPSLTLAVDYPSLESSPTPTVRGWKAVPCISPTPHI